MKSNKKEKELDIKEPKYRLEFYKIDKHLNDTKIDEQLYNSIETASIKYCVRAPRVWCRWTEIATGKIIEDDKKDVIRDIFEKEEMGK